MHPEVVDAMLPWLRDECGNPSSMHGPGRAARIAVEESRVAVAELIRARPEEIVFTSGGTESDSLALAGAVDALRGDGRSGVAVSAIEHEAVLHAAEHLRERLGCAVVCLPVGADGVVSPGAASSGIDELTGVVSVMHANNETGVIQPIGDIAAICRENGALIHVDVVQSVGKITVDVDRLAADMLSLSAHKIGGPKGVGALYIRRGTPFVPQMRGGAQERNRRAGTENVAGIVGFGVAARLATRDMKDYSRRIGALRDDFEGRLLAEIVGATVNGGGAPRVPNTLNVSFDGVGGEDIAIALDLEDVAVSSGSACASGSFRPSHVLLAMGRSDAQARSATRFSFGRGNTAADVGHVMFVLPGIVERLRQVESTE